ncbi:radical SAM protein [Kribbella sp. NBC_00482]|uniref:4Fe-4S single cluster domain-containing protein n=1 Tax=Kribbella sp. NBC_00482 TaxID=2975968 RepID=UPI002E18E867
MAHGEAGLTLRVARILAPVTALGPGRRVVLWVQGCAIGCIGCASVDTWDPNGGRDLTVDEVAATLAEQIRSGELDGLTITGGEPTSQPDAVATVVGQVRKLVGPVDVLVFSGRPYAAARRSAPRLVSMADCVVAGPFRQDLPAAGRLVASSNQTVHYRSAAVRDRYERWTAVSSPGLEVTVDQGAVFLVGIPQRGELDEFAGRLHERGVDLGEVSWRP